MSTMQKVTSLTLADFSRYLSGKVEEMQACYKEIEEVQYQFNDIFKRELAAWQEKFGFCFPRVLAQRHDLPAPLVQSIDQAEQEELAKLKQELVDLGTKIAESKTQGDDLLRQAQSASATLRQANPELNTQEENLKTKLRTYEDDYSGMYEKIEGLEAGFGWLLHSRQISKLRKEQRGIKSAQDSLLKQLRDVRKTWQDQVQQIGETQSTLRQQWETLNVATSQAQARLDFVQANLADLAQQQAITRVLSDMNESPGLADELGQALDELVARNKVRRSYEEGLRSVAEALGLTKGVAEGLARFDKSVDGVVEEQVRYTLAEVSVQLPQWVINVAETWKPLRERVKDEKYLGTHPLEFSQVIKSFISDRITDAIIQQFFETMGTALSAATAAWGKA
jgi:chromosome segregation ATPase